MKILNQTEETVSAGKLQEMLGDYGAAASSSEQAAPSTPPTAEAGNTSETSGENWRGDARYFQTGKKAGQLKPSQMKVTYRADPNDTSTIDGELLTGALFLTLIDLIMPMIIVTLHNKFSKKKIDLDNLQLSKEQKKQLEPTADKVVKQLQLSAHPNTVLIVTMVGLYGLQYATARMLAKDETKTKK